MVLSTITNICQAEKAGAKRRLGNRQAAPEALRRQSGRGSAELYGIQAGTAGSGYDGRPPATIRRNFYRLGAI